MSQSLAWDALCGPYHDAIEAGRDEEAAAVLREVVDLDVEHVRRTSGGVQLRACVPEFVVEDEYRDMTPEEARAARIEAARMWLRIDWTRWFDPPPPVNAMGFSTLSTVASIYKQRYSDMEMDASTAPFHPMFAMVARDRPDPGIDGHDLLHGGWWQKQTRCPEGMTPSRKP
jgi:hypothetical protein